MEHFSSKKLLQHAAAAAYPAVQLCYPKWTCNHFKPITTCCLDSQQAQKVIARYFQC